jgi:hypothetical protein
LYRKCFAGTACKNDIASKLAVQAYDLIGSIKLRLFRSSEWKSQLSFHASNFFYKWHAVSHEGTRPSAIYPTFPVLCNGTHTGDQS